MKYFSVACNPFSKNTHNRLQKLVDRKILLDTVLLQLLPIDDLRQEINQDLDKYDLKIEHVLLFYRPPALPIGTHVDYFASSNSPCYGSLVLPWVCSSEYLVYWEDGNFDLDLVAESTRDYSNIEYYNINWNSEPQVCYEAKINTPIVVRTHVPHGTYSVDSRLLLATVRFAGNPSFEELSEKFAVE
jgi:hypothetical protein